MIDLLKKRLTQGELGISLLFFITLVFFILINLKPSQVFFSNDIGLSFIIAKLNLSGDFTLLGPWSHIGGRHFGPIYYWYVILCYLISLGNIYFACIWMNIFKALSLTIVFDIFKSFLKDTLSK